MFELLVPYHGYGVLKAGLQVIYLTVLPWQAIMEQ